MKPTIIYENRLNPIFKSKPQNKTYTLTFKIKTADLKLFDQIVSQVKTQLNIDLDKSKTLTAVADHFIKSYNKTLFKVDLDDYKLTADNSKLSTVFIDKAVYDKIKALIIDINAHSDHSVKPSKIISFCFNWFNISNIDLVTPLKPIQDGVNEEDVDDLFLAFESSDTDTKSDDEDDINWQEHYMEDDIDVDDLFSQSEVDTAEDIMATFEVLQDEITEYLNTHKRDYEAACAFCERYERLCAILYKNE